jgi:hypothetical protein
MSALHMNDRVGSKQASKQSRQTTILAGFQRISFTDFLQANSSLAATALLDHWNDVLAHLTCLELGMLNNTGRGLVM